MDKLKEFIDGNHGYDFINQLHRDIFGEEIGCKCKLTQAMSRLNHYWEVEGKKIYENGIKD